MSRGFNPPGYGLCPKTQQRGRLGSSQCTMAMAQVFSTPDLVNHVFWSIKYRKPWETASALSRWCAVNKLIRDACKPSEKDVWWKFFEHFIELVRKAGPVYQTRDGAARLGNVFVSCDLAYRWQAEHPRDLWLFLRMVGSKRKMRKNLAGAFDRDMRPRWRIPYSSNEINELWEAQPWWKQSIYKMFYLKDANRLDQGVSISELKF